MICVRAITSRQTGGLWARDPVQGGACYPLSQNPYVYAWDDPVDRIDPTGKGAVKKGSNMFERYSEKAKETIFEAKRTAGEHGNRKIETEHVLLGLLHDDDLVARLRECAVQLTSGEVRKSLGKRIEAPIPGDLPLSKESHRALLLAAEEADDLGQHRIENEHILLGLLHVGRSSAARLLEEKGLTADTLRANVLARQEKAREPEVAIPFPASTQSVDPNQGKVFQHITELMKRGKNQKALKLLDEYMSEPVEGRILRVRTHSLLASVISRKVGDLERAKHYCEQAVAHSPDDPIALYALADCLELQGQAKEAAELAAKCYELSAARADVIGKGMIELLEKRFPNVAH
jgi:tetratricopeptide (TPR) repeat protein